MLLGSSLFYLYGFQAAALPSPAFTRRQWPQRILTISALTAAVGTVLWVMAETALFSGETSDAANPAAVWRVFAETRFGHACLWRLGLLCISLAATLCVTRRKTLWTMQVTLATLVIGTFAWTGHGAMGSGWAGAIHVSGDLLHLWVAGAWFGALLPLGSLILGALRSQIPGDERAASFGLDRFSAIGTVIVVALILSGLINSWFLIGVANWRDLFTSAYGMTLLVKLGLFALMLAFAAVNRFRLAPRLRYALVGAGENRRTSMPLRALKTSIAIEAALALLVLLAVGVLGTLAPPISGE